VNKNNE